MATRVSPADRYIVQTPHPGVSSLTPAISLEGVEMPQKLDMFDFMREIVDEPNTKKYQEFCARFINCSDIKRIKEIFEIAVQQQVLSLSLYILYEHPEIGTIADENPCIVIAAKIKNEIQSYQMVNKIIDIDPRTVNLSTSNGITPLFESSLKSSHIRVTKLLLDKGGLIYSPGKGEDEEKRLEIQRRKIVKALNI